MMLRLNAEYARRHLFALAVFLGLGVWFGYDGYVAYPRQTPQQLYASCHKGAAAPSDAAAEKFAVGAIPRQKQFMALALAAAAVVGLRLLRSARLRVDFDDAGFAIGGVRHAWGDVCDVDDAQWQKKGIVRFSAGGRRYALDAWHHKGVEEFHRHLKA